MFDSYKNAEQFKADNGYEENGTWYPRVTRIVGIKSKPALLFYYAEAANYSTAKNAMEESAKEGTLVHEAAEAILLGQNPVVDPFIEPAIAAFRKFLAENDVATKPEFVERRIVNREHRYAGTIDALATIDGKFGVLDIKTSQAIYRDYNLQTAAYMDALKDEFENLATRWILRIDMYQKCDRCNATRRTKGGRSKIRRNGGTFVCAPMSHDWHPPEGIVELQEFPFWQTDFEGFLGAKKLWEWENENWLKKIGYLA
ncbi:MAG TPA: hypothetical protein VMC43_00575 [Candidatus Paceibacterota bacterium]|nr:hypothetical protein [Candidatus Paceibacterota bacterium]